MSAIKPDFKGVIPDLPNEEYHASKVHISKSGLDKIAKAPAYYQSELVDPSPIAPKTQTIFDWGTAFHTAVLEPEKLADQVAVGPDVNSKAAKAWKEFAKENEGKILFTPSDYDEVMLMAKSANEHKKAKNMITGLVEHSVFGQCETTGEMIKCRPDVMCEKQKVLVDLKSTKDASLDAFSRACFNMRYHVQAAYYLDLCRMVTGVDYEHFVFVCVEKTKPYMTAVYVCTPQMIEEGRKQYLMNLRCLKWCKEQGVWPGYDEKIVPIDLPYFAYKNN